MLLNILHAQDRFPQQNVNLVKVEYLEHNTTQYVVMVLLVGSRKSTTILKHINT